MNQPKSIYRVKFINQDKLYEIYCSHIFQSDMYGFIEVEQLIFGQRSQLLVDPEEEKLQMEFDGVKRSYIPLHLIIRIDVVEKEGTPKMSDAKGAEIATFPNSLTKKQVE